ncbi:hypothetical protein IEQ34_014673 [Dendrobium chrysotoxum]|uniref:ATPase AAA-type core domain-containing protein n=1 Tax=Dendrobium chrysotoxum TaxID=161865 RepID=A0AAV7GJQ4_DENCH|nr:hypothetical protein IEQ34_014671 [Dendrobium chrysotoxum]KAH0456766.1 hypothetical protein IEQ34_014673 [Dendrobium chrysotoxum]
MGKRPGKEDAAFEENLVSEFDVMKSMLRERYAKQSEQSVKKGKEEKNVEIEAAADEKRKIAIAMKKGGGSGKEAPVVVLGVVGSDHRSNMVSGRPGEKGRGASEESIRDLFNKAYRTAPSIVFIDEIDVIASKRENLQREMERLQLMTCMDESQTVDQMSSYVLVIRATNRPDAVDQALRRLMLFDREIALGVSDENVRAEILLVLTGNLRIEDKFDRFKIARFTLNFVGVDLAALVSKAGNLTMKRIINKMSQLRENVD